ncbi:hypothetical protein HHI36_022776 [Cryptolaemus montrouzieri]|uniref:Actin-related protein 8 n=1 Tax=Cryptolaemus montrouzieri TaxID=559131 RepID=A0ABD2PED6_9CUCU
MLTNHLKDILSYRQYHVMEETYVINQVKEDTCFVSEDFKADLKIASVLPPKNHILRNYMLPDFNTIRRGYIQDPSKKEETNENCQVLRLNNERFAVPEILFTPSDIGISSVGLVDCLIDSIKLCPKAYHGALVKNIIIVGGNALMPGFKNRVIKEFQSKMPAKWSVDVTVPEKPSIYAWQGGKSFLKQPACNEFFVTKKEYDELGSSETYRRFNEWKIFKDEEPVRHTEIKPLSLIDHINKYNIFRKDKDQQIDAENESQKSLSVDSSNGQNKNILAVEAEFFKPLTMLDDKITAQVPEKSSEPFVGFDNISKPKSNQIMNPPIKYFFENEDSEEES